MIRRFATSIPHQGPSLHAERAAVSVVLVLLTALSAVFQPAEGRRRYYHERASAPAAAMAIDVHTGRILYSKNASVPRFPASITKVMTLYLLFDALRDGKVTMKTELRISAHAADQSPTKLDLSPGDTITVADAIGAIVTKSANDIAVAVAEALAGSEDEFARRMTQKARTIGMLNTTFRNASGLPNADQMTTAQDLIVLGRSILADHPDRCRVFATKYFQYKGEVYRNHNTLLFTYEGMEGMKTGFTSAAGFNLIATARRGDKRVLAVVLGGESAGSRNAAMRTILDNSWPKAMTLVAARKAGMTATAVVASKAAAPQSQDAALKPSDTKSVPAFQTAAVPMAVRPILLQLHRKPDQTSLTLLIASIEMGLVHAKQPPGASPSTTSQGTDEPDETAARNQQTYAPPAPQDIARNETLVAQASTAGKVINVSVHYKTVRPAEVTPLAAASLDPTWAPAPAGQEPPQAESPRATGLSQGEQPAHAMERAAAEQAPQTLAAATAATSRKLDQPGPFHVQVGAFADETQAEQRLQSVKQALGAAMLKQHPEFIMPVSLPTGVTMFRARLSRFADEAQAKSVCRKLKRSGMECWDIRAQ